MLPDRLNAKRYASRCCETTSLVVLNAPEGVEQNTRISLTRDSCLPKCYQINPLGCVDFQVDESIGRIPKAMSVNLQPGAILSGSDYYYIVYIK